MNQIRHLVQIFIGQINRVEDQATRNEILQSLLLDLSDRKDYVHDNSNLLRTATQAAVRNIQSLNHSMTDAERRRYERAKIRIPSPNYREGIGLDIAIDRAKENRFGGDGPDVGLRQGIVCTEQVMTLKKIDF